MKMLIKTLSTLLAVLMILGSLSSVLIVNVSAADATPSDTANTEEDTTDSEEMLDYTTHVFKNPEEALALMTLYLENDNYQMYFNEDTAVFAIVNKATGEIRFSNPYDVASSVGSEETKQQLLSQIHISYVDNGVTKNMYSYRDAVLNDQIKIKRIKTGVRVEYTIGDEATRRLVPRLISKENIESLIFEPLAAAVGKDSKTYTKLVSYFDKIDILTGNVPSNTKKQLLKKYPKCADMVLYALDVDIRSNELAWCEELIKGYCPDYTFEQMDADHEETGYAGNNDFSPVFKLALEYSLNEDGFTVRQPTNGLRYNTTLYSINSLTILPYMGAGNNYNTGYNMYPDGSGALLCFEDLSGSASYKTAQKIYGLDYAYHTLSGTYQKSIRMPVFGIKSDDAYFVYTTQKAETNLDDGTEEIVETEYRVSVTVQKDVESLQAELDNLVMRGTIDGYSEIETVIDSTGFFAIIEEGESLCELMSYHSGNLSDYHTVMLNFNPRPKDSYDISDSISVTSSNTQTIVSDRKYTGSLKIRYIMLSDETLAKETGFADNGSYYKADYVGMANAYSTYLCAKGVLERLTEEDVTDNVPLYVETFGAMEVVEQILSFPVEVMKPLTTFEDIETMYKELSDAGVKNINFKLTGYANGGMYSTVPSSLKWESAVGGKKDLIELLKYAQGINADATANLGIYPDFDLLYVNDTALFDGVSLKRDAARTIDDRYASKQIYSATQQKYISYYQMALSPAYIDRFYTKLMKRYNDYLEYGALGISLSTMGTDLSSDFDEDEPYNREDNKQFIQNALADISAAENLHGVMTNGGNAYTLKYVDHLLNVALDSSRFMRASYSIPFVGLVLHGYVQFAGTPLNMEGDADYAILKAIENGASIYVIMSYRNTDLLKEDELLSKYYSINYNIWKDDVISYYKEIDAALGDVQTKPIIYHGFLDGVRVLDIDEIEAEIADTLEQNDAFQKDFEEITRLNKIIEVAEARAAAKQAVQTMEQTLESLQVGLDALSDVEERLTKLVNACQRAYDTYMKNLANPTIHSSVLKSNLATYNGALRDLKSSAVYALQQIVDAAYSYESVVALLATAERAVELLTEDGAAEALIADAAVQAEDAKEFLEDIKQISEQYTQYTDAIYAAASEYYDQETLDALLDYHDGEDDTEPEVEQTRVRNNGNIVEITYGGKNGNDDEPYKTFILNYNSYSVTVNYEIDGETKFYTIPAGEYVTILR